MKRVVFLVLLLCVYTLPCFSAEPRIGGAWVELRKSPLFEAPKENLAETWGGALPVQNVFHIDKIYGRWIYGAPAPLPRMQPRDYAPKGWVYSRMLLLPDDESSSSRIEAEEVAQTIYYSKGVWKQLGLVENEATLASLNFFESLVLSKKTRKAFQDLDEEHAWVWPSAPHLLSSAYAAEEKESSLGLVGADLSFLKQEFEVVKVQKIKHEKIRMLKVLHVPKRKPLNDTVRKNILGRYLAYKYFTLPTLTHEEVDGYIYMRATALRALQACSPAVQKYWMNRHWAIFRVLGWKANPGDKNPWLQLELPGSYFPVSARAIDMANNEAELAFLLVRPLVRATKIHGSKIKFGSHWPQDLVAQSEQEWGNVLKLQSTRQMKGYDVSDEIAVDREATECISRAGYATGAAQSYLTKLSRASVNSWAKWYAQNLIGIDYRIENLNTYSPETLGKIINKKRYSQATKYWNILP